MSFKLNMLIAHLKRNRLWISVFIAIFAMLLIDIKLNSVIEAETTSAQRQLRELVFDLEQHSLSINGDMLTLDPSPVIIEGKLYVPIKFLAHFFGMNLVYDAAANIASLVKEGFQLTIDVRKQQLQLNGEAVDARDLALFSNDRIMLKLQWLSEQAGASYDVNEEEQKITVTITPNKGEDLTVKPNAKPIAKFVVDQSSYAMGEKITYTNLSYDPDADPIALTWEGKQDAFFTPGEHIVSLVAIDQNGNRSEPYRKAIIVTEQAVRSELEFQIYNGQPGAKFPAGDLQSSIKSLTEVKKKLRAGERRKLLISDSPEVITESGILYQDTIHGAARFYVNHLNATEHELMLAILATNESGQTIKLTTSRRGESAPSQYAMLVGSEAAIDFLSDEDSMRSSSDELIIAPGETVVYRSYKELSPQYSINAMYDTYSTGELLITVAAFTSTAQEESAVMMTEPEAASSLAMSKALAAKLLQLPRLAYTGHVRGSFTQGSIVWDIYPRKKGKHEVQRLIIGDGERDPFLKGFDVQRDEKAVLYGNYGVVYEINIHHPRKMAMLLMARGGTYKGAVKINNEYVRVPASGILEPMQSLVHLGKTDGSEKLVQLQFIAPAGSSLPIMLILYPLEL